MNLTKQFFKYVSQNIFGLIGTSCYILADTYFIAQAAGTDGVTLLNLCLPMYNLIFAFGSMIGLGAATRYAILQAQGEARAQRYFSNAILCACLIAIPFMLAGAFCPGTLLQLMGGDADIVALGLNSPYEVGEAAVRVILGYLNDGTIPDSKTLQLEPTLVTPENVQDYYDPNSAF